MMRIDSPIDPDYQQRIRDNFARQAVMAFIGAELTAMGPGSCEIRLPYRPELSQQNGYFHAGIIATVADSAAGYAGYSLMPADSDMLSVEFKLNLLRPAQGDYLSAQGQVIKAGKQLVIAQADVYACSTQRQIHAAMLLVTLMVMQPRTD